MIKRKLTFFGLIGAMLHRVLVLVGAVGLTLAFFLVLPVMQQLTKPPKNDLLVTAVDTAELEPPPPPPEEPEPEEPEPEEAPPELNDEAPPMDLSMLELALNAGISDSMIGGDFAVKLNTVVSNTKDVDALFSISDLDQKPRVIYQPSARLTPELRKKVPATVYIIFIVDQNGRVENPVVQKSSDPLFEKTALSAVKKWKFEPGKRNGKPVKFRMRVPISFAKG